MFDQILDIVRGEGKQAVIENPAVPNEQNDAVMAEAASSVETGMKEILEQQGPGGLKQMFQGAQNADPNNPGVQHVTNNFAGNLTQKFGIPGNAAKAIGVALIPLVLSRLFKRTKDPNDNGFSIGGLLSSLTGGGLGGMLGGGLGGMLGGSGGGLGGMLGGNNQQHHPQAQSGGGGMLSNMGNKLGLDKDGDGDTDMQDLMKMFR